MTEHPRVRSAVTLLTIALVYGGLAVAGIMLTRGEGRIAAVWLSNAFLLAVLLRRGPSGDRATLGTGFAANLLANLFVGDTPERAGLLALANSVEVAIACFGTRWACGGRPDMTKLTALARFMLVGGVIAPAASASVAAVVLAPAGTHFSTALWLGWLITDGLGLLIATPSLLIVAQHWRDRVSMTRARAIEWLGLTAIGTLLTVLVFSQNRFPFLFLISPIVLVYAFRLGAMGTAVSTASVAVIASIATSMDNGPISLVQGDLSLKLMVLQAFLVTSFLMGMPVAAALEGRDRDRVALRRERDMSRSMLENMREVVFRTDAKGRWIFLNPAWEQLTGYPVSQSLGWSTIRLLHPDDLPDALVTYLDIESGEIDECLLQQRFTAANGEVRQIEVSVRALRGRSGQFKGTIGNLRDVTDREASLAALAAREEQLALLANNATDAIFRLGLDGSCLYASPSSRDLLGIEQSYLVGANMLARFHPDDHDRVVAVHRDLAAGTIERSVVTYRSEPFYGATAWMWLEANCGLVRDPVTGGPREIIASIRDISERKALELALDAARANAEAAGTAKSTFLANMSHEIRTPMTGVIGFTDLMLEGDLSPEQRHHAQMIADSGRSLMRLLNDILDISKVEAGQMRVIAEPFDLRHAMLASLRLVASVAEQKGVATRIAIDDDLPSMVIGDSLRLRQIVLNLLSNAVKFTPAGEVSLRVTRLPGADMMEIAVADTGIGIPQDRLLAILAPFQQADDSTARRFGGTGLGLAISDQLARLMGGGIAVESEVGRGTCFTLRLPLIVGEEANEMPPPLPEAAQPRALRILLAEDHDINQIFLHAILERQGHGVDIAVDGAEAVAKVLTAQGPSAERAGATYDLVLMDMQMRVVDGIEATRMIRARGIDAAALPIIALTANAYAEDVDACLAAGMQAHLSKPIKPEALAAAIARHVPLRAPAVPSAASAPEMPPGLRTRYAERRTEALDLLAAALRENRFEAADVAMLTTALHQLAGTAGMFGESDLGERARELETRLGSSAPEACGELSRAFVEDFGLTEGRKRSA